MGTGEPPGGAGHLYDREGRLERAIGLARYAAVALLLALGTVLPSLGVAPVVALAGSILAYAIAALLAIAIAREVTTFRKLRDDLVEPLLRAQDALGEGLLVRDGSRFRIVTEPISRITGHPRAYFTDLDKLLALVPDEERPRVLERLATHDVDRFEVPLIHRDGRRIWVEVGRHAFDRPAERVVALVRDVTERRVIQQELEHQALHDPVTDLPNFALLKDRMALAIAEGKRFASHVSLLILDLRCVPELTRTIGHDAGDALLRSVAERLRARVREVDTVARIGLERFGILLPRTDEPDARHVAQLARASLDEPVLVPGMTAGMVVPVVIGLATWPQHASAADDLLRNAEIAAHQADRTDERVVVFAAEQQVTAERFARLAELRAAMANGQIVMYYQPVIDLAEDRLTGFEGLVRWAHPREGILTAATFIDLAESGGLVRELLDRVLENVARDMAVWEWDGHTPTVAVNLSPRNLLDDRLPEKIGDMLRRLRLPSRRLSFEITESAVMAEPERSIRNLRQIAELGPSVFLDDFGTGHSSLAWLDRLPVDGVKIDRSFVARIADPRALAIVRAATDLAHGLGLRTVAEGVEDAQTLSTLKGLTSDAAQGYLIGKPMPSAEVPGWMDQYDAR